MLKNIDTPCTSPTCLRVYSFFQNAWIFGITVDTILYYTGIGRYALFECISLILQKIVSHCYE